MAGARAAFEATQAISQKLAALDPANADWQRDLAVSQWNLGIVAERTGDFRTARCELERALAIFERLAQLDPANPGWREDRDRLRDRMKRVPGK